MTLKEIKERPTSYDMVHESIYRSYHILNQVLDMIKRGDSSETILETVDFLRQEPIAINNP